MQIPLPEAIGTLAALLTTGCWLPQAIKIIKTKDTRAISLVTYSVFALGVACWLVYGILINSWPIMIANVVTLLLAVLIIALKIKYEANGK